MIRRSAVPTLAVAMLAVVQVAVARADTRVTNDSNGSYARYDGAVDETMASCSTGRRTQNEPSVAIDPANGMPGGLQATGALAWPAPSRSPARAGWKSCRP